MDPVTVGAVLLAIVSGASGELGSQLWTDISGLARTAFRRRHRHRWPRRGDAMPDAGSGLAELTALKRDPGERRAMALATALIARGMADADFQRALERWWEKASQVPARAGSVTNTVSGGHQYGPVLQGRDFSALTLNSSPTAAPPGPSQQLDGLSVRDSGVWAHNEIKGGSISGTVLQGRNFTFALQDVAPAQVAVTQLPPRAAGFTGRDDELAIMRELLDPAAKAGPVVISAVAGLAGVGKTALVVQAGHAAREQGWFGGGVLFIDLHGYDDKPIEPTQALEAMLRSLGVTAEQISPDSDSRSGLYRSMLARISEPVLIIADNATSEAQVRPLLPGAGPHRIVITSRHILGRLDARLLDVPVLGDAAGLELLDKALRAARPADERISRNPEAAARLVAICGGLPLALQIAAALLKADASSNISELADDLSTETKRLSFLEYDDGSGTRTSSVAAAFELSYRHLDEVSARVFRMLPLHPGPDLSTVAAASLTDLPVEQTRRVLRGLARAHLIEAVPDGISRWRMHDLMRLYAAQLEDGYLDPGLREQAIDRMLGYYLTTAEDADKHLRAVVAAPRRTVLGGFTGREDALTWLNAERPNLAAALRMASTTGREWATLRFSTALAEYFNWPWRFDDLLPALATGLSAARAVGDRREEGIAQGNLGLALREARRFEDAINALRQAAAIFQTTGYRHGESAALTNLGLVLRDMGRLEEAISAHQDAVAMFRETPNRRGQGMALNSLGVALSEARRFEQAMSALNEAAAIFCHTGDLYREAMALDNLGVVLRELGRFGEAVSAHEAAAALFRDTGDRHHESRALRNIERIRIEQFNGFPRAPQISGS